MKSSILLLNVPRCTAAQSIWIYETFFCSDSFDEPAEDFFPVPERLGRALQPKLRVQYGCWVRAQGKGGSELDKVGTMQEVGGCGSGFIIGSLHFGYRMFNFCPTVPEMPYLSLLSNGMGVVTEVSTCHISRAALEAATRLPITPSELFTAYFSFLLTVLMQLAFLQILSYPCFPRQGYIQNLGHPLSGCCASCSLLRGSRS